MAKQTKQARRTQLYEDIPIKEIADDELLLIYRDGVLHRIGDWPGPAELSNALSLRDFSPFAVIAGSRCKASYMMKVAPRPAGGEEKIK